MVQNWSFVVFFVKTKKKCTSTCCCLLHFVEFQCPDWRGIKSVVSSCDLFISKLLFFCWFVCFLDKSSSSEARRWMYEGWKLLVWFFFFPHESNNHWSSPQRTHRHHQQVTQSTKRRAQLCPLATRTFSP